MVNVHGGTFVSDHGYAVFEGIAKDEDGSAADRSAAAVSIGGGSFDGAAGDVRLDAAEDRNVVSGGTFSSDVSAYAAEGYAVIGNADGTYGAAVTDSPEGVAISGNGQTISYDTDGSTVTIPSAGGFADVTLDLGIGGVDIVIVGDITGDVTVSYGGIAEEGADIAFNLHIAGVDPSDMTVSISVPVTVPSGYSIGAVYAYSVVEGETRVETAYASGDSIVIETDHNTPFYVSYELESDLPPFIPFPPEQGGDPVEVYPSQDGGTSDDGDDTLKTVAVAAAAVIAAILAIVLASTYRKN